MENEEEEELNIEFLQPSTSKQSTPCCLIRCFYICCCCTCFRRSSRRRQAHLATRSASPDEYIAMLERPESRQLDSNNLLSVPKIRGPLSLSDRRDSSSYGSSIGLPPSVASTSRLTMREFNELPDRLKKMRKKSASDISILFGILRHGTAMSFSEYELNKKATRSSSLGNLRTTVIKRARRRNRHNNLQQRLENMSPHHLQIQMRLGKNS